MHQLQKMLNNLMNMKGLYCALVFVMAALGLVAFILHFTNEGCNCGDNYGPTGCGNKQMWQKCQPGDCEGCAVCKQVKLGDPCGIDSWGCVPTECASKCCDKWIPPVE